MPSSVPAAPVRGGRDGTGRVGGPNAKSILRRRACGRQAEGRGTRDKGRGMRDDGRGMKDEGAAEGREGAEWEERGPGDGVGRPGGRAPVDHHRRPRRTAGFCQAPTLVPQILRHSGSATGRGRRGGWERGRDGQCAPEAPRPGKGGLREA